MLLFILQFKSLVQVICGDKEGARETQERYVREGLLILQIFSLILLMKGDKEGARNTQKMFLKAGGQFINEIPVVGHGKGIIHYACGYKIGGDQAMKRASRTVGK